MFCGVVGLFVEVEDTDEVEGVDEFVKLGEEFVEGLGVVETC